MMVDSESLYMALRGGMSDHDRDVSAHEQPYTRVLMSNPTPEC
jgi:hypothetical protein